MAFTFGSVTPGGGGVTSFSPFVNDPVKRAEWDAAQSGNRTTLQALTAAANSSKSSTNKPIVGNTGLGVPKVTSGDFPSFLPTDPEPMVRELQKVLKSAPGLFNVGDIMKAFQGRISADESLGRQTAENASREFGQRTWQEGGDPSVAGVVRAQALLPVLMQSKALTTEMESKKLDANQALGNLTSSVANSIGQLRTNYLNTLASYTSNLQNLSESSRLEDAKRTEGSRQFDASYMLELDKLEEEKRRARLAATVAGASGGRGPVNFTPGYIPNAGALTTGTQGKAWSAWPQEWTS